MLFCAATATAVISVLCIRRQGRIREPAPEPKVGLESTDGTKNMIAVLRAASPLMSSVKSRRIAGDLTRRQIIRGTLRADS